MFHSKSVAYYVFSYCSNFQPVGHVPALGREMGVRSLYVVMSTLSTRLRYHHRHHQSYQSLTGIPDEAGDTLSRGVTEQSLLCSLCSLPLMQLVASFYSQYMLKL